MQADREKIRRPLLEIPGLSARKIAYIFDCEPREVRRIRMEIKATGEIPEPEVDEELIDDI